MLTHDDTPKRRQIADAVLAKGFEIRAGRVSRVFSNHAEFSAVVWTSRFSGA